VAGAVSRADGTLACALTHFVVLHNDLSPPFGSALENQRRVFECLGCAVEDAQPVFADADEVFKTLSAWRYELAYGQLLEDHRDGMKDTVVWNIEEGARLSGPQIGRAERKRTVLFHRVRSFMQSYEFLVSPVSQVPPSTWRSATSRRSTVKGWRPT
jgi:amidase